MLRFQVLGAVAAYGERGPVALGPPRQRTVLAALVYEPGTAVGLDQLIERVWGAQPPRRARETMHAYLSRLRAAFGEVGGPTLVRREHGYALEVPEDAVDLYRFRALVQEARRADDDRGAALWQEAFALWRGAPLADLDSDWARGAATALEAERLAAALDHSDLLLRRGAHQDLLPQLTADAAAHPLDERLAGQLMLALYRTGRQADALTHYQQLRRRLADQIGSAPGPALQELHRQLLQQDPALVSAVPEAATDEGAPATSHRAQLPADVAGFTGRTVALDQLCALLGPAGAPPSTVVITAIGGSGGIGKTALAVHWAHQVRHRFPDGQLYLNLRGFDPGGKPMTTAEAARLLLDLLQVPPDRIPASTEAQIGLYRSRLAGTRTLVVLDNARDATQVRPLLPGTSGCMAVVTSRDQLAGLAVTENARLLRLDVLSHDEARHLLVRRLGAERVAAEPDAVDAIVAACAGLPLALAIVAAHAATRPRFPLATFAAELTGVRGRLDALASPDVTIDVRTVFSWSYDALSPPAARMFRLLGLHPGPDVSLPAAASLAGRPASDVRRLLAELTSAHLVAEHAPGRYVLHDLLRSCAAELAETVDSEPDRLAARHRMLDHYLQAAAAANDWLPSDREPVTLPAPQPGVTRETLAADAAAQAWFTTELPVLLTTVDQEADAGFDLHIQRLAWAVDTFLIWRGLWHHKIAVQLAALRAARRRSDRPAQAAIHRGLAHANQRLDRRDAARSHIREARSIYDDIGDHAGQARTLLALEWMAQRDGRHQDALRYARQCLEAANAAGNPVLQALARNAIGWCHTLLGEHEQAIAHCRQALAELRALGEPDGMATVVCDVLNSLGRAHRHLGQHREAIDCYQQAVDGYRRHGIRQHEAENLVHLGDVHHSTGDVAAAREAWQRALEISDEVDLPAADELRERLGRS